ncbi:MAG: T9SS type A sorting domain-containing protein, partial [Chitinophagales bacterium]|nr:T9SS type A sorting domain-containing protein [Chitinophagales bacterium]
SSAIAYQWYLNQQIISGATNQKYVAAQWGEYSVAIKDENDCTSFSQNFEVNVIDISVATRFQIFPNPVGDILNVSFSSPDYSILDLKILNPLGQLLFQKEIVSEKQLQITKSVFNGSKIVLCELLKDGKLIAMQKVVIE